METAKLEVAVLGAGVIGLSSAVAILEALHNHVNVTLIADKFEEATLSDGAAGIIRPNAFAGDKDCKWLRDSWKHFVKLSQTAESNECGVYLLPTYMFTNDSSKFNAESVLLYKQLSLGFHMLDAEEMSCFPGRWKHGAFMVNCIAECRCYLPYLLKRFRSYNQNVIRKHVYSLEELCGKYDVVVNCSGFAARTLCGDYNVIPVRGQVMRVKAPWLKHAMYGDYSGDWDGYILPGQDNVVIGGCRQYDKWHLEVDAGDRERIWEKVLQLIPSLKNAEVERDWVGLRPYRDPIRLELETMRFGDKKLNVIHNYGHGGGGVCLSWGCAQDVVAILSRLTKSRINVSRL